jgi:hypothetical protein
VDPDGVVIPVGAFRQDLHDLANWLQSCGVTSLDIKLTSVYWMPAFENLDTRVFEIVLVKEAVRFVWRDASRFPTGIPPRLCRYQFGLWLVEVGLIGDRNAYLVLFQITDNLIFGKPTALLLWSFRLDQSLSQTGLGSVDV